MLLSKEQQIKYVAWVTMLKTSNTKKGDNKIKVKAHRSGEDYKIELSYPGYNVLKIKED